jgi:phage terminase large subunit-like protein
LNCYKILCNRLKRYASAKTQPFDWDANARDGQKVPKGDWRIWLILAGRGFGKTRTGAETIRQWVREKSCRRICLLGHHMDEVRKVMIEGNSGLLAVSAPEEKVVYEPSKRQLTWPCGAMAVGYSAHAPQRLRGPQFDAAWIDELAKFEHDQQAWDQLMMGLRLGSNPRVIITTTPRPTPLIKQLLERNDVVVTRGTTWDNASNLPKTYLEMLTNRYTGTAFAAQELQGLVMENQGKGLWKRDMIVHQNKPKSLARIVVAIDPAVSEQNNRAETGIIVAGMDHQGMGYVLDDCSGHFSATQWIKTAVSAYEHSRADRIIAEINNGGDMVQHLLHSLFPNVPYQSVYATRSKRARAEPIAALYEQKRVVHCGYFHALEEQMVNASGPLSDRMDALVWALYSLFFSDQATPRIMVI